MTYAHLTINKLVIIESYVKNATPTAEIARLLHRSRQTIHKVVQFFKQGFNALDYLERYQANKKQCGRRKTQLSEEEKNFIQEHLDKDWSLDVIKGTFPDKISCSMRTLYRLGERGILSKDDFPWKGKRKANGHTEKRGKQAFRRSLVERELAYPNFQNEFGHLEGDTIIGQASKSAVVTLAERMSKLIITLETKSRKAKDVQEAVQNWLQQFPRNCFKSITFDCGKEFSNWKEISNQCDIAIFFADPGYQVNGT
ncbi:Mobile element protein [Streptococcus oralis]|uniref:Mobile element protein n=1 Tax=Streptococcus oralis TaxID=1303 RepID=A0A139RFZ0_STROR|nr:IS30 family transposase [Streptococcus oralis]KXU13585.1 Mobile element protein [Streptococcus oralis]